MAGDDRSVPTGLNIGLAAAHLVLNLFQFFILPLYLLPMSPWWALLLLLIAASNNSFWSLIHEAIHDLFNPSLRVNEAVGRFLSVLFGSPFRLLRLSHLMHHTFNRTPQEATGVYDPQETSMSRAGIGYYGQILGGLFLLEALSPLLFYLPRRLLGRIEQSVAKRSSLNGWLVRNLMKDNGVSQIRKDYTLILSFFALSVVCYGKYWVLLVFILLSRGFLISFLDNVYHYRTPVNDVPYALNLRLPYFISKILLYFNLHGIHHDDPTIPWIHIPQFFALDKEQFGGIFFTEALAQLAGPIPISELPESRSIVTT